MSFTDNGTTMLPLIQVESEVHMYIWWLSWEFGVFNVRLVC
jgi:hypothetical protein